MRSKQFSMKFPDKVSITFLIYILVVDEIMKEFQGGFLGLVYGHYFWDPRKDQKPTKIREN